MNFARSKTPAETGDICGALTLAKTTVTGKCHLRKSLVFLLSISPGDIMTFYREGKSIMCVSVYAWVYVKFTYAYIGLFKTPKCHDTNVTTPNLTSQP